MRVLMAVPALAVCVLLSGCDGVACGEAKAGDAVYVDVTYGSDGMPAAAPAICTVASGATITWRGPVFDGTVFDIESDADFRKGAAAALDERAAARAGKPGQPRLLQVGSASSLFRQKITAVAGVAGTYKYDIAANGKTLDPEIVIPH